MPKEAIMEPIMATDQLDGIITVDYDRIKNEVKSFNRGKMGEEEYNDAVAIITNKIYLIYEKLHLNIYRDIDYTDIKHFAISNNEFVKYVLKTAFPGEESFFLGALDNWTKIHVDLLVCSMHEGSNHYNKHIYH